MSSATRRRVERLERARLRRDALRFGAWWLGPPEPERDTVAAAYRAALEAAAGMPLHPENVAAVLGRLAAGRAPGVTATRDALLQVIARRLRGRDDAAAVAWAARVLVWWCEQQENGKAGSSSPATAFPARSPRRCAAPGAASRSGTRAARGR